MIVQYDALEVNFSVNVIAWYIPPMEKHESNLERVRIQCHVIYCYMTLVVTLVPSPPS
jgi:hypothetical protein